MGEAEQRVALVTGAARGIGAATVHALVEAGIRVVAVDSCAGDDHEASGVGYRLGTRRELDAVAGRAPDRVLAVRADVRRPDRLAAAARAGLDRWQRMDVAVAAAAVIAGGRPTWADDSLGLLWEVDVAGVWHTAAATVPLMLAGPDPSACRFVAVSSSAGLRGHFGLGAYGAAKHAVIGLVRGLSADLTGTGVRATAVAPGATDTDLLAATADLYGVPVAELAADQPDGRPLRPEDVAAVIRHCCVADDPALDGAVVEVPGAIPT